MRYFFKPTFSTLLPQARSDAADVDGPEEYFYIHYTILHVQVFV